MMSWKNTVSFQKLLPTLLLAVFLPFTSCTTTDEKDNLHSQIAVKHDSSLLYKPADATRSRSSYIDTGDHGMVVAAHPAASRAGIAMLKKGGNAVDAAVAASFAISVVRPQSTGIGGGGFLLLHHPKKPSLPESVEAWDFRERAPKSASRRMYLNKDGSVKQVKYQGTPVPNPSVNGHLAAGVPGLVKGLVELQEKHGRLSLATVMAPAIELAERGFPVYQSLANALENRQNILKIFPATRAIFFPKGEPLKAGDLLVQKDLAHTLKLIAAKGSDGFYSGTTAAKIIAEMQRGKGLITAQDLKNYSVKLHKPIMGTYKGYRVFSMPPPSSGGIHIVQMLNIIEQDSLSSFGFLSVKSLHLLSESMRRAFADRAQFLGDTAFVDVPVNGLLSKSYAKDLRSTISLQAASTSKDIGSGNPAAYESNQTTHLSIVDREGMAVSTTQTVNYLFGSGVVVQGAGFFLNDEMDDFSIKPGTPNVFGLVGSEANAIQPGKTMLSSMTPTLVFDQHAKLKMVLGSPGGPRIINATFQTVVNMLEYNLSLPDAVHAYRVHQQWLPDQVYVEKGMPKYLVSGLQKLGHKVHEIQSIGDVQAIARDGERWIGVSDTRSDGKPMGFNP